MKAIVEAHGGTVEKFIGDAVMAVFGISTAHEDDALRACRAAVEMRDALPELGIAGRIGVNTGEVVTGTQERLATGDAVNVAARLEQAAVSHDGSDGVMASWRSMLARDLFYLGRFDEVEPLLDAARIAGWHPVERTFVPAVEALLLSRSGAHDQAAERARAAVATAETETDNVWLQGWSNEDIALVLKRAGRVDEAGEALKRALTVWERKRCLPYVRRVREHIESLGRAQA